MNYKKKKYFLISLLLFIQLSAKLMAQVPPVWLNDPTLLYPVDKYEIAMGEGCSRTEAENTALGNLSRIFGTTITMDSRTQNRYAETPVQTTVSKNAISNTTVSAAHELLNVSLHTWHNSTEKRFFALAVMPRLETMQMLLDRISANDEASALYLEQSSSELDLLYRFSLLDMAAIFSAKNEIFIQQFNTLAARGGKSLLKSTYNYRQLRASARAVARNITFSVATDESALLIQAACEKILTELGMRLNDVNPVYTIASNLAYEGNETGFGLYVINYRLVINLQDSAGTVIKNFSYAGTDGGKTKEDSLRILRTRLANTLINGDEKNGEESLSVQFNRFLDSLLQ